jgi:hypothetical protein
MRSGAGCIHPIAISGELRPADAARVGRLDCIEAALDALDAGVFV